MLKGINIFDAHTVGGDERLIGNIVEDSEEFGTVVGFENHSGLTYLGSGCTPAGNRDQGRGQQRRRTHHEGARVHNVIGTYLHGSLLPKNPKISDYLIEAGSTIVSYGRVHS